MTVPWFGLQCWNCFCSVSSRDCKCCIRLVVDNTDGSKVIQVSLEKSNSDGENVKAPPGFASVTCGVWIAPGLGIWKVVAQLAFLYGIRVCRLCWCSILPALHSQEVRACLAEGSYSCSLLPTGSKAKFLEARSCNVRISLYSII